MRLFSEWFCKAYGLKTSQGPKGSLTFYWDACLFFYMALLQVSLTVTAYGEQTTITVGNDSLKNHGGLLRDLQALLKIFACNWEVWTKHIAVKTNDAPPNPLSDLDDCSSESCEVLNEMAKKAEALQDPVAPSTSLVPMPPSKPKATRRHSR
eukprot:Skav216514  [mRNA]  locus=scaffold1123:790679:792186:- [translate_table: standard]